MIFYNLCHLLDGIDYQVVTQSPVTLTSEYPYAAITIHILEDYLPESSEILELALFFYDEPVLRLDLNPSTATVTIVDNEGKQNSVLL